MLNNKRFWFQFEADIYNYQIVATRFGTSGEWVCGYQKKY